MLPHSSWSFKAALLPPAKRIERKDRPPSHNIWSGYSPGLYIHIKILRVVIAAVVTENNSANRIIFCVVYELGNSPEALEFELPLAHSANLHMSQAGNLIYSSLEVSLHWTQKALFFFSSFLPDIKWTFMCVFFSPYKIMIGFNKNITHLLPEGFVSFSWTHSHTFRQLPALCSSESLST